MTVQTTGSGGNVPVPSDGVRVTIDGFEIIGLCSRDVEARPEIAAEFPAAPRFSDYAAALQATKPDAVSINTWPDTHAALARRALQAGAHVFIEKPLAETVAEAEAIVALAKARGRKLMIGYILRVHPSWAKFVEIGRRADPDRLHDRQAKPGANGGGALRRFASMQLKDRRSERGNRG